MSLKRKTILQCLNDPFPEEVMLPSVLDEEKQNSDTSDTDSDEGSGNAFSRSAVGGCQSEKAHFVSLVNKFQVWQ